GHEGCGAVTAALSSESKREEESKDIQGLLARIQPALLEVDRSGKEDKVLSAAVEANVRWSMRQLGEISVINDAVEKGSLQVVGAVYDIETGKVNFLD
ncbi:MAG: carbonic anhydrase, partial [Planctomycetota bacterium]